MATSCIKLKETPIEQLRFICKQRSNRGDYCKFQSDVIAELINREYKKEVRYENKNDSK